MTEVGFGVPPSAPGRRRFSPDMPTSRDFITALIVAASLVVSGVPLGLLWAATAPKLDVDAALSGSEAAFNNQAGIDVYFAMWTLIFGVVAGVIVGWRYRNGSWPIALGVAIGGLGGALLAGEIGHLRESDRVLHQVPADLRGRVSDVTDFVVRAHGFYVVFPVAALIVYLIIIFATTHSRPAELPEAPEPDRYWSVPH